MNEAIKMQISAFVDGELPENEKELLLRRLSQDTVLRQQVAEYLAIGHALRGEVLIGGIDGVRRRIARVLDEKPLQDDQVDVAAPHRRFVRPLAGLAIAASVALVAIIGLRQVTVVETQDPALVAGDIASQPFPTQPEASDLLRQYELMHGALASDIGASNIRARLTSLELLQENVDESSSDSAEDDATDTDSE
ncbi:MAG: RseA family anti-sigma factor [Woeseiaceae bacterium]|nr:RseA family anti-sigma factor [Woeseiaceae bacterium]